MILVPIPHVDLDLIRKQADVLFRHDAGGRITHVNEPDGARAPRFFLGRTVEGHVWRFRDDLDAALCTELERAIVTEPHDEFLTAPYGTTIYAEMLARFEPVTSIFAGPAYRFPAELPGARHTVVVTPENIDLLRPHLEPWMPDVGLRAVVVARVHEGQAVSVCASVRENDFVHEAGVETASAYRGRGFAIDAVAHWASAVRGLGRTPLYSTEWENKSSQALAAKLGLVRYGTDLSIA